jgi:hypothetical protein
MGLPRAGHITVVTRGHGETFDVAEAGRLVGEHAAHQRERHQHCRSEDRRDENDSPDPRAAHFRQRLRRSSSAWMRRHGFQVLSQWPLQFFFCWRLVLDRGVRHHHHARRSRRLGFQNRTCILVYIAGFLAGARHHEKHIAAATPLPAVASGDFRYVGGPPRPISRARYHLVSEFPAQVSQLFARRVVDPDGVLICGIVGLVPKREALARSATGNERLAARAIIVRKGNADELGADVAKIAHVATPAGRGRVCGPPGW